MAVRPLSAKINRLKCSLAQDKVEEGRVVRLNDKEEHFFQWDVEECRSNDDMTWVAPYVISNQVGVPWYSI